MGQDSSQEAPTGSANTPADPTRTPSATEDPDSANEVFGQIAVAIDASQSRRKSHLLQEYSPGAGQKDSDMNEDQDRSQDSKKKKRRDRQSGEHGVKSSKKDRHIKSLGLYSSQIIPEVASSDVVEAQLQQQETVPEVPGTPPREQPKSKSKMPKNKKPQETEADAIAPVLEEQAVQEDKATAFSTREQPQSKKSKKEKRKDKRSRQLALGQPVPENAVATPETPSQEQDNAIEPASAAIAPGPGRQQAAQGKVPAVVIPESSLPFPATPSLGSKKKMKTFMSAQKKKIIREKTDQQEYDAIPPTQPSQAEETQVQNSYEPTNVYMAEAESNPSPSGSPAVSDAEAERNSHGTNGSEGEEEVEVVKAKKVRKSKNADKEKKLKRRLPIDDVTDTPSKRARFDIQTPSEPESTKSMMKKAKRKAALDEGDSDDEKHVGVLSDEEWKVIDMQLEKYRGMHDMTVEEQNRIIHGPVSKRDSPASELFNWVMEEIHHRKRWSVIHAMRRKYHDFDKRGAWAPEDDEELMAMHARFPAQWKEIGSRLNRHPDDCRDRWRYVLVCGTNIHWGRWSLEEEQLLQKVVDDALSQIHKARQEQASQLDEEERAEFFDSAPSEKHLIDWQVVSEKMGRRRGMRQCAEKYKLLEKRTPTRWAHYAKQEGQAVLQTSKMTLADKINLVKALQEGAITEEDGVDWNDIADKIVERDSAGNLSQMSPKFSKKSAEKAWQKLRYLLQNANSLSFQEIVESVLDKLTNCEDQDPSKDFFQPRIGGLDLHQKVRVDLKPAKRSKHNIIVAAAMTLEEKRDLLIKLQTSKIEKEEDVFWPKIFPAARGVHMKFEGGWESKKLAWELLVSFLGSIGEKLPAEFQERVKIIIEKLDSADGQDPTRGLFLEEVTKKSLQDDLREWKDKKSSFSNEEAVNDATKKKIANMRDSSKLKILEALSNSGVRDENDIVWSKHGYLPFMKKSTYPARAQREVLKELKTAVYNADDYEFQDLISHMITELSRSMKEKPQHQNRTKAPSLDAQEENAGDAKSSAESKAKRKSLKTSKLSKKVIEGSDDGVDENVVESLNTAANSIVQVEELEAELDGGEMDVTTLQTPSSVQSSSEESASPVESPVKSPVEERRKDLYEFDEDELGDTILKSAMKRRSPKKLSALVTAEASAEAMSDVSPEAESERDAEAAEVIDAFAAFKTQRRKAIQQHRNGVVDDSDDETSDAVAANAEQQAPMPSSPPLTLSQKKNRGRKNRKEKRHSEVAETQEDEEPSALEILQSMGSQKKSPPQFNGTVDDAIPPTSSFMPTMSQVIKSSKKKKKAKRQSEIIEVADTQEEAVSAVGDAEAPVSSIPAPFPDIMADDEMPPPSSIMAPFPDIPAATQDAMPMPSSIPPPSSPPQTHAQKRKAKKAKAVAAAAQAELDAQARPLPSNEPATPSPEKDPFADALTRSLKKARKSLKRAAETSVGELEAEDNDGVEATQEMGKGKRRAVEAPFTPRASKRERKQTFKAMTPYK